MPNPPVAAGLPGLNKGRGADPAASQDEGAPIDPALEELLEAPHVFFNFAKPNPQKVAQHLLMPGQRFSLRGELSEVVYQNMTAGRPTTAGPPFLFEIKRFALQKVALQENGRYHRLSFPVAIDAGFFRQTLTAAQTKQFLSRDPFFKCIN